MAKVKNYQERCEEGIGKYMVYNSCDNPNVYGDARETSTKYLNRMESCHFRGVNRNGVDFSLIESDTPNTYTFHFKNVLVTDVQVSVYIGELLRKDFNLYKKYKALRGLYRVWNFKEEQQ